MGVHHGGWDNLQQLHQTSQPLKCMSLWHAPDLTHDVLFLLKSFLGEALKKRKHHLFIQWLMSVWYSPVLSKKVCVCVGRVYKKGEKIPQKETDARSNVLLTVNLEPLSFEML